jgi:hydroxyethylthiazole kinase-like uncharacterized protein yjeF
MALPVINIEQMREWEAATWATGMTEAAVIQRVGKAIAERALAATPAGSRILILAGKGHNGDDARAAIPHLQDREVILQDVIDPVTGLRDLLFPMPEPALIIDGLFGIGINRPLSHEWRVYLRAINNLEIPILSIDVPSGLNADSGEPQDAAIQATITLTIGTPKRGLLRVEAADFVGRLEVADDVGFVPCPCASELQWTLPADFHHYPPPRIATAHKGSFGHAVILAGSVGFHGAAALAAKSALRAQPGLVTLFTDEPVYVPVASQLDQAMVHPWKDSIKLPPSCTAIAFGPGLAAADFSSIHKDELRSFWKESRVPVIVDASALDWLPPGKFVDAPRIITPHPGEAARLLDISTVAVQRNRVVALRHLSSKYGDCLVILKGHHTLIGNSTGPVYFNSSGNPHLGQGGSGDVLLGFLAGLFAQPFMQKDVVQTARFGVWQHGAAADALTNERRNWTTAELIQKIGDC